MFNSSKFYAVFVFILVVALAACNIQSKGDCQTCMKMCAPFKVSDCRPHEMSTVECTCDTNSKMDK